MKIKLCYKQIYFFTKNFARSKVERKECSFLVNQKETAAREAKNAYMREWRAKNKDKVKATQERYWQRQAKKLTESESK